MSRKQRLKFYIGFPGSIEKSNTSPSGGEGARPGPPWWGTVPESGRFWGKILTDDTKYPPLGCFLCLPIKNKWGRVAASVGFRQNRDKYNLQIVHNYRGGKPAKHPLIWKEMVIFLAARVAILPENQYNKA